MEKMNKRYRIIGQFVSTGTMGLPQNVVHNFNTHDLICPTEDGLYQYKKKNDIFI